MRNRRLSARCLELVVVAALMMSSAGTLYAAGIFTTVTVESPGGGRADSTTGLSEIVVNADNLARADASLSGQLGDLKVEARTIGLGSSGSDAVSAAAVFVD